MQMNGQPTAEDSRVTGSGGNLSGFRDFGNPRHVEEMARLWNVDPATSPDWGRAVRPIKSQRHEGWTPLLALYDDGGYSGGSTDRPALKRLLADIQSRLIDVVGVYKVDRLTRSLTDFAKIV